MQQYEKRTGTNNGSSVRKVCLDGAGGSANFARLVALSRLVLSRLLFDLEEISTQSMVSTHLWLSSMFD